MRANFEKQLVDTYGISWAQAKQFLKEAREQTDVASNDTVFSMAAKKAQVLQTRKEQAKQQADMAKQSNKIAKQQRKAGRGRHVILTKTYRYKIKNAFKESYTSTFSLEGKPVTFELIEAINQDLQTDISYTNGAKPLVFKPAAGGRFDAEIDRMCHRYHEEHVMCCILETLEDFGLFFRIHFDSTQVVHSSMPDSSFTKEVFIFGSATPLPAASFAVHSPPMAVATALP